MNRPTMIDYIARTSGDQAMTTFTATRKPEGDWLTNELMQHVRKAPLDSDAIANIPLIIAEYERRKTFKQKLRQLVGG